MTTSFFAVITRLFAVAVFLCVRRAEADVISVHSFFLSWLVLLEMSGIRLKNDLFFGSICIFSFMRRVLAKGKIDEFRLIDGLLCFL